MQFHRRHATRKLLNGAFAALLLSTLTPSALPMGPAELARALGEAAVAESATQALKKTIEAMIPPGIPGASRPDSAPPVSLPKAGSFNECLDEFPRGHHAPLNSVPKEWLPLPLCFKDFAVLYSGKTKTPLVVVERLNRSRLESAQGQQRSESFFEDGRLAGAMRAQLADYAGSGYDRGHMAPAANMPDQVAMIQSFVLTNIVPQDPFNNREIWSKIESDTRKYVRRAAGNVFVYTGPIFRGQVKTVGAGRVWVPSHLFKLVYDESTGRAWAHILENSASAQIGKPVSYAEFVRMTGWRPLGEPMPNQVAGSR